MKRHLTFLGAALFAACSVVCAQEVDSSAPFGTSSGEDVTVENGVDWTPEISLDARFGYEYRSSGGAAGFGGDGLLLNIDGKISKNFSYSFNHYLSGSNGEDGSVFDATNWLTLSYDVGNFTFTAGKDALYIGSFEYDAYDLDCYFDMNSMFYNSISCWQWGASAMWTNNAETSSFAFQWANSPFAYAPKEDNLYAYNLAWYGAWDWYESIWSINVMEYERGNFVKMFALGNNFYIGDFTLTLDYMARMADLSDGLGNDYTFSVQPAYNFGESVRLFGKLGVEHSADDLPYDFWGEYLTTEDKVAANEENPYVMPAYLTGDKEYVYYGAGVEYFPLKETKNIRLHAIWASNNYTKRHMFNVGLTWKFDVVNAIRHIARTAR